MNERTLGSVEGYRYADGLLKASTKGLLWSADALTEWLKDPEAYIKQITGDDTAHTRMIYRVNNEVNRGVIVEYLLSQPKQSFSTENSDSDETQFASKCLKEPQPNVDLSGCDLVRVDFSNADLRNANLRNTRLIAANLNNAMLSGADLTGASLGGADLRGADLSGADLTDATMIKALIPGANVEGALFHNAIYVNARRCGAISVGECQ